MAGTLDKLANLEWRKGRAEESIALRRSALEKAVRGGGGRRDAVRMTVLLASNLIELDRREEAERDLRDAISRFEGGLPKDDVHLAHARSVLGWLLMNRGEVEAAAPHIEAAAAVFGDPGSPASSGDMAAVGNAARDRLRQLRERQAGGGPGERAGGR
jgi:hypothetical protein